MINPMDLTGKLVLVTGASSGIGRETCIYLSKLGARVILVARREDELQNTLTQMDGNNHTVCSFDLTELEKIEPLVKSLVLENGKLDGCVYAAGVGTSAPFAMCTPLKLHQTMSINFYPFFELARIITKKKYYNSPLSIVGISSIASLKGEGAQTMYAASKAAMDGAVRSMALELSSKGIRVNTVLPNMIRTPMYEEYKENYGRDDSYFTRDGKLGLGEPIDVALMIAYLLSDAAKFITGSSIKLWGGDN